MRGSIGLLLMLAAVAASAGQAPATFPAQQRPPGDPAQVQRGNALYGAFCRACHGADLRGGDLGGPNLLRSQMVLSDASGDAIARVVREGRVPPAGGTAMPPVAMADEDLRALSTYIFDVLRSAQPQGAPPRGAPVELNLLVGDRRAGERYFNRECARCHSASGDLAGIGARLGNIETLQNSWVAGRRMGAPAAGDASSARRAVQVTVRFADGRSEGGELLRLDDFVVSFRDTGGRYRSYTRRSAGITGLAVDDPLTRHRELWSLLTDKDMHDVTAYLASLK